MLLYANEIENARTAENNRICEQLTSDIMTVLINEGKEEGRRDGDRKARRDIAAALMETGMSVSETTGIVGLSAGDILSTEETDIF